MAINIDSNRSAVAYHIVEGPVTFPYAVDAQSAIGRHPLEWSADPWNAEGAAASRKRLAEQYDRDAEIAKSRGLPPPAKPVWIDAEPVQPTPEEQAAIDEHTKAVAEANERLKTVREKLAEEKKIAEQIAADEALVASPPPRPDPTAVKRPFGRTGEPTPAELEQIKKREAKKAEDERLAREKATLDAQSKPIA